MNESLLNFEAHDGALLILDWAVCVTLFLAGLIQFVINRDPRASEELPAVQAARWVLFVSLIALSGRFFYLLTTKGDVAVPLVTGLSLFGIALSNLLLGLLVLRRKQDRPG